MSKASRLSSPSACAANAAPSAPAAGPLSIMRTGMRPAVAGPDHAARAQHDERGAGEAFVLQPPLEPLEIGLGDRHRVGVHRRGRGAQVFADLRRDFRALRDAHRRQALAGSRARHAARSRHCDSCAGSRCRPNSTPWRRSSRTSSSMSRSLWPLADRAVRVRALVDRERMLRSDQRLGKLDLRVVHVVAPLVADPQDVGEAAREHHRGARAFALDQRIGDDGRGVHDRAADVGRRQPRLGKHRMDAVEEAAQQVVGRGRASSRRTASEPARSTTSVKVPPMSTASATSSAMRRFHVVLICQNSVMFS